MLMGRRLSLGSSSSRKGQSFLTNMAEAIVFPIALVSVLLLLPTCISAQSTSHWISVKGIDDSGKEIDPAKERRIKYGTDYVTVSKVNSRIFQNSRWYRNWIERDRKLVETIELRGTIISQAVAHSRISQPFEMRRNDASSFDTGWNVNIAENIPSTFERLEVRIQVSKSAKNGLSDLLQAASAVSQSTPALAMSPQAVAVIGATKALSDFMFNNRLLESKIDSTKAIDTGGDGFVSGFYVIFAGDTTNDYQEYMDASTSLKWDGRRLMFGTEPVEDVTYIVVRVKAAETFFPNKSAAPLSSNRSWATLYNKGRSLVSTLNKAEDFGKLQGDILSLFTDAHVILGADLSLTESERTHIHDQITTETSGALLKRLRDVTGTTNILASPIPNPSPSPSPTPE